MWGWLPSYLRNEKLERIYKRSLKIVGLTVDKRGSRGTLAVDHLPSLAEKREKENVNECHMFLCGYSV